MADPHELDILQALPRFLFLEETIEGRRVLEVGARNTRLAAFLLELGAKRVVCAAHDEETVMQLREQAPRGVDVRQVREGVLPGDDGAFDLVIDFSLPVSLASEGAWRAEEVERLLSDDGFALTAVTGAPEAVHQPVLPVPRTGPAMGYRQVAELLNDIFDVVEVYFQSLLIGYLIGSFDADPSDDGVAPETGLMGEEVEPASFYIFAFGHAVPLVEDISLIQIPVSALESTVAPRALPDATPGRIEAAPAVEAASSEDDDDEVGPFRSVDDEVTLPLQRLPEDESRIAQLTDAVALRDDALASLGERLPALRNRVDMLVEALQSSESDRERALVHLEQLQVALQTRDVYIEELSARAVAFEQMQRVQASAEAQNEDAERERASWLEAARRQIDDIAQELNTVTQQRDRLAQAATVAERRASEAHDALVVAQDREQVFQRELARLENLAQRAQGESQTRHATAEKNAALENELAEMRVRVEEMAQSSAQHVEESRIAVAEEHARRKQREAELDKALIAVTQSERAQATILEERKKLAEGVNRLVQERARQKKELAALRAESQDAARARSEIERLELEKSEVQGTLTGVQSEFAELQDAYSKLAKERDAEHARVQKLMKSIEDKATQVGIAQNTLTEISAQRDTLARVVQKRDQDLTVLTQERASQQAENERLHQELVAHEQRHADEAEVSEALRAEVDSVHRQKRAIEKAVRDAHQARDTAVGSTMAAKRELDAMSARLDDEERTRQKLLDELRAQHDKIDGLRGEQERAQLEMDAKERAVADAHHALVQEQRARERATAELEQLHTRVAELDAQLSADAQARDVERTSLTGDLNHSESVRRALEAELTAARETLRVSAEKIVTLTSKNEATLERLEDKQGALAKLSGEHAALREERNALEGQLKTAQARIDEVTQALESVESQHQADLTQQSDLDASVRRVRQERDRLRTDVAQKERDLKTLKDDLLERTRHKEVALANVAALTEERDALKAKVTAERTAFEMLSTERDHLKVELAAKDAQARDAEALLKEGERATDQVFSDKERAADAAQQAREALADAERRLLATLKEHDAETSQLSAALEQERSGRSQAERLASTLRNDVTKLERDYERERKSAERADAAINTAAAEIAELTIKLGDTQSEQQDLLTSLQSKSDALIHREKAILALTDQLASAEEELNEKGDETARLLGIVASLRERSGTGDAQVELLGAQLGEAQEALNVERARGELYRAQLDEAQREAYTLSAQREIGTSVLAEARTELKTGNARAELLAAGLEEAQHALDTRATRGALLQGQLEEAQAELVVFHDNVMALRDRLAAQKRAFAATEERLGQELAEARSGAREERDRTEAWERRALEAEVALDAERSDLGRSLEDVQREVDASMKAREETEAQYKALEGHLQDATERVKTLEQDRSALLAEVQALKGAVAEADAGGAQAAREELRLAAADLAAKTEETRQLKTALEGVQADLDAAKSALITASANAAGTVATAEGEPTDAAATRIAELERSVATLRADIDEKNDRINRLTQRLVARDGL